MPPNLDNAQREREQARRTLIMKKLVDYSDKNALGFTKSAIMNYNPYSMTPVNRKISGMIDWLTVDYTEPTGTHMGMDRLTVNDENAVNNVQRHGYTPSVKSRRFGGRKGTGKTVRGSRRVPGRARKTVRKTRRRTSGKRNPRVRTQGKRKGKTCTRKKNKNENNNKSKNKRGGDGTHPTKVDMSLFGTPSSVGPTSLHQAASAGDLDGVNSFINNKDVSVDMMNDGKTALHLASFEGHTHIVERLLDLGANIDAVDNNGKTALHLAMSRSRPRSTNSQINVVKLLLERGANVNIVTSTHAETNGGNTAKQIAEKRNLGEIVELIEKIKEVNRTAPLIAARPPAHSKQSGPQVSVFRQDGLFDNIKSFIPYADA